MFEAKSVQKGPRWRRRQEVRWSEGEEQMPHGAGQEEKDVF